MQTIDRIRHMINSQHIPSNAISCNELYNTLCKLPLFVSFPLTGKGTQALEMNPMTMKDWIEALDGQIIAHKRKVLIGKGNVSHQQAIAIAEKEFEI